MYYWEELRISSWSSRKSESEPKRVGPEGEKRSIRCIKEIKPEHEHMTLDQLKAIYSDNPPVVPLSLPEPSPSASVEEPKAAPFWDDNGWDDLVEAAIERACSAMALYPQPNYVITKLAEEAGEVVKEAVHHAEGRGSADRVKDEIIDLLAMTYRLWIEGDSVHGLKPVCEEASR